MQVCILLHWPKKYDGVTLMFNIIIKSCYGMPSLRCPRKRDVITVILAVGIVSNVVVLWRASPPLCIVLLLFLLELPEDLPFVNVGT